MLTKNLSDDASGWFQPKTSHRGCEITSVFALPWQLGVGFSLGTAGYLVLFTNSNHTSNFFKFIINLKERDGSLVKNVVIEEEPTQRSERLLEQVITQKSSASDGPVDWTVQYLALCSPVVITKDLEELKLALSPLVMTTTEFLLLHPNFGWLIPSVESTPEAAAMQKVANVVDVSLSGVELKLHFLNESQNQEEVWSLTFASLNAVNLAIESVRTPWEQLFSVPLQLSTH